MPQEMPAPQGAPAPAPEEGQESSSGAVTELVTRINDDLIQLLGGLSRVDKGLAEELKPIVEGFRQFVQGGMGSSGQEPEQGLAPAEAGNAKVQQAL